MTPKQAILTTLMALSTLCWPTLTQAQTPKQSPMNNVLKAYKYSVQHVTVHDTTQVAYIDQGQGPQTLLFVHGLATYLPQWYPMVDHFKNQYRCIAIDLPGYGRSSKGPFPGTMEYYAQVVLALIEQLNLENPILVGHSMGGQIAITAILHKPELFKQLVLLAPAGFETFTAAQGQMLKGSYTTATIAQATEAQIRNSWKLNFFNMPASVEFMIQDRLDMRQAADFDLYCQAVVNSMHGMLNGPIFDRLKEVKTKTLVVYGQQDMLIPNKFLNPQLTTQIVAQNGAAQLPNATLKFIDQCGHFIPFDKPEQINEIMGQFLME